MSSRSHSWEAAELRPEHSTKQHVITSGSWTLIGYLQSLQLLTALPCPGLGMQRRGRHRVSLSFSVCSFLIHFSVDGMGLLLPSFPSESSS